ncbi:MAG: glutamate synthase (NADPH), homotetrameric [Actinobacteria bacterium HGW-Actinobacteria-10]|jgi:glutamate synthase (NADPH/NADH) small chain|nr:MAG: glutamate synthase (NADPH), homotetrameric [Actinobacteria bacterium HGW-Actinobacteria-10]
MSVADDIQGTNGGGETVPPERPRHKPSRAPRTPMPERDAHERASIFDEVATGYLEEMAVAEANRCLQCRVPTCQEGCPVGIDIKGFIREIIDGDYSAGVSVLKERNALPAVCGRVCPQEEQCEAMCVLAKKGESVAIGRLERFLGDYDLKCEIEHRCVPEIAPATGKRCAVVGSGPAGLACAGELARLGHEVTIFESLHAPGGVLTYGIPEFRLPKAIVEAEIDMLSQMGVTIECDVVVGASVTVAELLSEEGFDSVFVANGAGLPVFMGIPGENLNGVYSANEFLTRVNLMRAYEFPKADTPVWRGRKVAVVGGGNVAMDSARTALRLGAEEVFLVYRRTADEMPARREEVHHAEEEGVEFKMLCSPVEITGRDGFVTGIVANRMELGEPDSSGRRAPVCVMDSEFEIECDTVIMAVGTRANPLLANAAPDLELNKWGYIVTDEVGSTSIPGVFAGGDIVTGAATVILAMGAGKTSAKAMDVWMSERQ